MNIKDFAIQVLNMNDPLKTQQAIANLKHGLQHEEKWDYQHKAEVKVLIEFLESGSKDITELDRLRPVS